MKLVLTLCFSFLLFTAGAQTYMANVVTTRHAKELEKRTLVVVPFNNAYDQSLMQSVKDFWTLTPCKEASSEDMKELRKNDKYAFLYLSSFMSHDMYIYGLFLGGQSLSSSPTYPMAYARVYPQVKVDLKKNEKETFIKRSEDAAFLTPFYVLRLQASIEEYYKTRKTAMPRLKLKRGERALFSKGAKGTLKDMTIFVLDKVMTSEGVTRFASYLEVPSSNIVLVNAEMLRKKLYERNGTYAFVYENDDFCHMVYDSNGNWLALATSLTSRKNRKELNSAQRTVFTSIGISLGCIAGLAITSVILSD